MSTTGLLLALFGPDGSGKSTTAMQIEKICKKLNFPTSHYHWRPRLLPSLIKDGKQNYSITTAHNWSPRSKLISLFLILYFYLDFLLGHLIWFRPLLDNDTIIIYERYYYDLLFHPQRYRLRLVKSLSYFLTLLLPRPDLIVLLWGNPSEIYSRKQELSIDEIRKLQIDMKQGLQRYGRVLVIDVTNLDEIETASKIINELIQLLNDNSSVN